MDILKELFGTCDELQISKSLFGAEVGHEALNISLDQSFSSSRENIQRPLPLLPEARSTNPPPLLRSQSLDDLHTVTPDPKDEDIMEIYRSDGFRPQSAFPQLNESAATTHVDLHHVPPEMPMYLLQEDEGNDEEIMRLLSTQPLAFSQAVALVTTSAQTDTMTMESSQAIAGGSIQKISRRSTTDLSHAQNHIKGSSRGISESEHDILAEATSIIPDDLHLLVSEATNEVPDDHLSTVNNVLSSLFRQSREVASTSASSAHTSSVTTPGTIDNGLTAAIHYNVRSDSEKHTRAVTSRVLHADSLQSSVQTTGLDRMAFMVNEATQTSSELTQRSQKATHSPSNHATHSPSNNATKQSSNKILRHLSTSLTDRVSHLSLRKGRRRSLSLNRFTRAQSAPNTQPSSPQGNVMIIGDPLENTSHLDTQVLQDSGGVSVPNDALLDGYPVELGSSSLQQTPTISTEPYSPVLQDSVKYGCSSQDTEPSVWCTQPTHPALPTYSQSAISSQPAVPESPIHIQPAMPPIQPAIPIQSAIPIRPSIPTQTAIHIKHAVQPIQPATHPALSTKPSDSSHPAVSTVAHITPIASFLGTPKGRPGDVTTTSDPKNPDSSSYSARIEIRNVVVPMSSTSPTAGYLTHNIMTSSSTPDATKSVISNTGVKVPILPQLPGAVVVPTSVQEPIETTVIAAAELPPPMNDDAQPRSPSQLLPNNEPAPVTGEMQGVDRGVVSASPELPMAVDEGMATLSTTKEQTHHECHLKEGESDSINQCDSVSLPRPTTGHINQCDSVSFSRPTTGHNNQSDSVSLPRPTAGHNNQSDSVSLPRPTAGHNNQSDSVSLPRPTTGHNNQSDSVSLPRPTTSHNNQCDSISLPRPTAGHNNQSDSVSFSRPTAGHNNQSDSVSLPRPTTSHNNQCDSISLPRPTTGHNNQCASISLPRPTTGYNNQCDSISLPRLTTGHNNQTPPECVSQNNTESSSVNQLCSEIRITEVESLNEVPASGSNNREEQSRPASMSPHLEIDESPCTLVSAECNKIHNGNPPEVASKEHSFSRPDEAAKSTVHHNPQEMAKSGVQMLQLQRGSSCFPFSGWRNPQAIGFSVTPIHVLSAADDSVRSVSTEGEVKKLKRRRGGGGWPKGKKRKILSDPQPPKPPSTGYALFLSERRPMLQKETGCQSMSLLSKTLGRMWGALSKEEKEVYYSKADSDKQRYLEELRAYLTAAHKETSSSNLEALTGFLNQSFESEANDDILVCHICDITFITLHNKRTHYSGKIHREALLGELNKLLGNPPTKTKKTSQKSPCEKQEKGGSGNARVISNGDYQNENGSGDRDVEGSRLKSSFAQVSIAQDSVFDHNTDITSDNERSNCKHSEEAEIKKRLRDDGETPTDMEVDCIVMGSVEHPSSHDVDRTETALGGSSSNLEYVSGDTDPGGGGGGGGEVPCSSGTVDHYKAISLRLREYASSYGSYVFELEQERLKHSQLLEEYSRLQQQCKEIEYMEAGISEDISSLHTEEGNLLQQIRNISAIIEHPRSHDDT